MGLSDSMEPNLARGIIVSNTVSLLTVEPRGLRQLYEIQRVYSSACSGTLVRLPLGHTRVMLLEHTSYSSYPVTQPMQMSTSALTAPFVYHHAQHLQRHNGQMGRRKRRKGENRKSILQPSGTGGRCEAYNLGLCPVPLG